MADRNSLSTADWVLKQWIISWVNYHLLSLGLMYSGNTSPPVTEWGIMLLLNCLNKEALPGVVWGRAMDLEECK